MQPKKTRPAKGATRPENPTQLTSDEIPNPWVGSSGDVAHPESPRGGGGTGNFRLPGTVDGDGKQSVTIPQPNTLMGRNHVLSEEEVLALEESKKPQPKKNPPPKTKPKTIFRKAAKNIHNVEVDLTIKILNDLTGQTDVPSGRAKAGPVFDSMTAGFEWAEIAVDKATKKVIAVAGVNKLQGLIELQIRYASGVKPDQKTAYGRGTTASDIAKGDITIGFHEHCHIDDWLGYLKSKDLPLEFEGKVGMTTTEYQQKQQDLEDKFQQFIHAGDALTLSQTDEVGNPTLSEFRP